MDEEFATMNDGKQATSQPVTKTIQPQHSTEAPCSANVKARIGSYDWQITCRSHVDKDDLINMAKAIKWWNVWLNENAAPSSKATAEAINVEMPTVTATTVPPAPVAPATAAPTVQTIHAVKLQVAPRADGKVDLSFFESGHQYADIKATKTPADAAILLQPIGAWTPQHFAAVAEYSISAVIDWKPSANLNKNGKPYKNIITVTPA